MRSHVNATGAIAGAQHKMSWETRNGRGRYYTRSWRRGGKVVRKYFGTGGRAAMFARADALNQKLLAEARQARARRETEGAELDAAVAAAYDAIELLARAALMAAGYRQHHRGEWRKSRGNQHKLE
jgi:hypothetical protein